MSVFVDTGVLFAAAAAADDHHREAAAILATIAAEAPFTTDHVLVETWWLLRSRGDWSQAMAFWRGVRHTPLRIEPVAPVDLERAQATAETWSDQQLDIVDCTSFAVMERTGCARAATFDRDFAIYRYGPRRKRAFEILRER